MTIREARLQAGMTQQQLADRMKVARTTVTGWECGSGLPRASRLRELANVLDCSVDELLEKPAESRGKT